MKYPQIILKGKTAHMLIDGALSEYSPNNTQFFRHTFERETQNATDLDVYINTAGGDVFIANELYNIINAFKGQKTATLGAICASAGTTIACACDKIIASENTNYMIHNPQGSFDCSKEADFDANKSLWNSIRENIASIYVKKTNLARPQIIEMMDNTTWMNAEEAKNKGFVDEILPTKAPISNHTQAIYNDLAKQHINPPQYMNPNTLDIRAIRNPDAPQVQPETVTQQQLPNLDNITKALDMNTQSSEIDVVNKISLLNQLNLKLKTQLANVAAFIADIYKLDGDKLIHFTNLFTIDPQAVLAIMNRPDNQTTQLNIVDLSKHILSNTTHKTFAEMTLEEKQELKANDPKEFDKLFNEHIK